MVTQPLASSPTSVVEGSGGTSKPELVSDESDCEASNPQQGTRNRSLPSHKQFRQTGPQTRGRGNHMSHQHKRGQGPPPMINAQSALKIPPTLKDSRKLFVGGLPPDVTSEEFYNFFVRFGTVLDSVVMFDKATKRSRGFGFITYDDPNVCQYLLQMGQELQADGDGYATNASGYLEMRGKLIEIKRAEPKQSASPTEHSRRPRYGDQTQRPPIPSSSNSFHHVDNTHPDARHRDSSHYEPASARYPVGPYGFPPMTPMPYYAHSSDQAHHVTPQAALDFAHHMLFYSQLLATPTLMNPPMISPMVSPAAAMGYEPQSYSEYFQYSDPNDSNNRPAPRSPIPPTKKKVSPGHAFQIGGGTFIPESSVAPPSLQIPKEGPNDPPGTSHDR